MTRIRIHRHEDYSRTELERIYAYFDRLHDIAGEGHAREVTDYSPAELVAYLHEICFTLDETIREIEGCEARLQNLSREKHSSKEKETS